MIRDEVLYRLSPDPEIAFVELEVEAREWLDSHRNADDWDAERRFINTFCAFQLAYQPDFLVDMPRIAPGVTSDSFSEFDNFIQITALRLKMKRARESATGRGPALRLNIHVRRRLHFHLAQMRETINAVELPENKRDALFSKISALSMEIDSNRTKWESWMELSIQIAETAEKVGDRLDPTKRIFDAILRRLGRAKQEAAELCGPEKMKQLEGPKVEPDQSDYSEDSGFDEDEIPF